jgi:hypothetical protein
MKFNKWTLALAAVGVVSMASVARAEETPAPANVLTALPATTLSGYVDTSASLNFGARYAGDGYPIPNYNMENGGNLKRNGFSLNVVDVTLDHPEDTSEWAAGYHVELWFGPDGTSLGTSLDGSGDSIPAAIRQAYITLRTPIGGSQIDWKLGVFDTIIGYEGLTSYNNPCYSRSYGFNMEPTTHTGLLATYAVNSALTVQAGVANTSYAGGYTAAIDGQNGVNGVSHTTQPNLIFPTVMGAITLTAPDSWGWMKGASTTMGVINTASASGGKGATSFYAGLSVPTPMTALKFGAAFDYLEMRDKNFDGAGPHNNSDWNAGLYASYQATDKLALNLRGEYLNNHTDNAFDSSNTQFGGDNAEEVTFDVSYDLWKNVLTRAEFRWDHPEHYKWFSNAGSSAYDVANAYLFAVQAIYKF